ncbi:adenylate/guanylate cyclase domain-containing protein [Microvirga roseola]|uniref:adenylate/guanylate cyclase domain-containing protein n=1 Tax=Microvirga roseola TaxID=2883126 RepID=UPI001E6139CA|nr:adenylate/guanylate cyclase domain-containing protein [Microvirga roseola]
MPTGHPDRRLTAILAADIAGYSRLMGSDEEGTLKQLNELRRTLVEPIIAEHHGRLVKTAGDGMLVEFASSVEAVRCAVEFQRRMAERNAATPSERPIEFRIGINVGDIIAEDDDIFGDGVNVAARLEGLASPGGICVSSRVHEDVEGKIDVTFADIGERRLKNIARPIRVFRLRLDRSEPVARSIRQAILFPAAAAVLLLLLAALWAGLPDRLGPLGSSGPGVQSVKPAELGAKPVLAVLPFVNQGEDKEPDYFADGLTQDLISALGQFSAVTVMSWNAVAPYKERRARPGEIGQALGVRYQVEGSIRPTDGRVRIAAQLVDRDGRVLWSSRFDEPVEGVFVLQDKITAQIAGALAIEVAEIEQRRVLAKPTDNLQAYDYVLRARPALQRPTRSSIVEARALLRRAIELDPGYAAAYSALAETYLISTAMGWVQSPEAFLARAEDLAHKALSLDASEVRARIVLGRVHIFHLRYEQAKAEMDQSVALNPNDADGLAGRGNILTWLGHTKAAIEALERAQRINPEMSAIDRNTLSLAYYLDGRYAAAIEQAQINLREALGAQFGHALLAAAYAQQERLNDATEAAAALTRVDPTFDPQGFGSKLRNPSDLAHLREGLRKAGLYATPSLHQR